ncbi:uncharacterized protein A4U43_C01F15570 [Asparagus officinalis]|uniref:Uncharacterized protein n=1 Tax=Asparagus officinalis TaxID=4686 RepID=A0A5P1FQ69_ASPOF|nr:uncharacterized protein A4U43_C01F15570 [Asparagus officinalis]
MLATGYSLALLLAMELARKGSRSKAPGLQDFLEKGTLEDEELEAPSGQHSSQRPVDVSIWEPSESAIRRGAPSRERGIWQNRLLQAYIPQEASKK